MTMLMQVNSPATEHILACEAALDRTLVDRREVECWNHAWTEPAACWSKAVADQARRLGSSPLSPEDVLAGERVAASPVFVCGPPRSGTTLMRDLLDGHPALAVLPAEGRFFAHFAPRSLADQDVAVTGECETWVKNLANPTHQRPFWLLGRSAIPHSGYVRFARAYLAWSKVLAHHDLAARVQTAAALALAQTVSRDISALRRSVDKTPGYEFRLQSIWSRWPNAKVIYLLRDPAAVAASYERGVERAGLAQVRIPRLMGNLVMSHLAARWALRCAPEARFCVIDYDRLVQDRAREMARVASFLGIAWSDCLLEQTILGHRSEPNSSFPGMLRVAFSPRNTLQGALLSLALRSKARVR